MEKHTRGICNTEAKDFHFVLQEEIRSTPKNIELFSTNVTNGVTATNVIIDNPANDFLILKYTIIND